jgi:predicted dehydrogenase
MKKVGLGIIGLGYIGKIHLRHGLKLKNARIVGVSDLSKRALNDAKILGVKKTFTNYEELLKEPNLDSVIIGLPTHLHLDCAIRAIEAGKDVFLEKPIARNVKEAKEIVSAAQRNSVKLMIGYPHRFNAPFRELKEKIESGELGDVEIAYATFISSGPFFHRAVDYAPSPVPEWWFDRELTGGGALMDLGCHLINLLRWYFGEITDIDSYLGHRFNIDLEDHAICMAQFDSGTTAAINIGWFSQEYQLKIDLFGSVSCASAQHRPENRLIAVARMLTTGTSKFYWPHLVELQYFANCLIQDLKPSPSGEDGLRDLEAISLAYKNIVDLKR